MKQVKQRVVALDYFRGICILIVVINHAVLFSMPLAYITGAGGLWTSAAEMFFLLSGLTFAIIRGDQIKSQFKKVIQKTWRRAGIIYLVYLTVALASLLMALNFMAHGWTSNIAGSISSNNPLAAILNIAILRHSFGWADFLMFYSIYLILAPFIYYGLRTKLWPILLVGSAALYVAWSYLPVGSYREFAVWQLYFVIGMVIGRFRYAISSWFNSLSNRSRTALVRSVVIAAGLIMTLSYLVEHSIYPLVGRLAFEGWLPVKLEAAYLKLINQKPTLDHYLLNNRTGVLRPLVTLLIALAAFIIYQRYQEVILKRTGNFVNMAGRDSMWIFVMQALAIPALSALPVEHGPLLNNLTLTSSLILMVWLVTKHTYIQSYAQQYFAQLKLSFYEAKSAAMYRQQNQG